MFAPCASCTACAFNVASGPSSKILNCATSVASALDTKLTDALSLSPSASVTVCVNTIDVSSFTNFDNAIPSESLSSLVSECHTFLVCVNFTTPFASVEIVN